MSTAPTTLELYGARVGGAQQPSRVPDGVEQFETDVVVQFAIPELALVYADDREENRYVIDRNSVSRAELTLVPGQWLTVRVTDEGHVQEVVKVHS